MTTGDIRVGMRLPTSIQICTRCRTALPLDAFSPDSRCRSGHTSACRQCCAEAMRAKYLPVPKPTLLDRFNRGVDEPVEFRDPTDCWEWKGSTQWGGYGSLWPGLKAHRVAYELFVGPIPHGLTIDHLCYKRACVNPAHLEAVTLSENVRRARFRQEFLRRIAA